MRRLGLIWLAAAGLVVAVGATPRAESPKGSITIERIAEIKYPTSPQWSPDGAVVAFLWDAAGKQDLFVAAPGQTPVGLTDFPVDPHLLQSDIGEWAWASPDEILFSRGGAIWTVSPSSPQPARLAGIDADGAFALSTDLRQIVFVRC